MKNEIDKIFEKLVERIVKVINSWGYKLSKSQITELLVELNKSEIKKEVEKLTDDYFHKGVEHHLSKISNKAVPEKDYQNIKNLKRGLAKTIKSAIKDVEQTHGIKFKFDTSLAKRIAGNVLRIIERYSYYENRKLQEKIKELEKENNILKDSLYGKISKLKVELDHKIEQIKQLKKQLKDKNFGLLDNHQVMLVEKNNKVEKIKIDNEEFVNPKKIFDDIENESIELSAIHGGWKIRHGGWKIRQKDYDKLKKKWTK